MLLPLPIVMTGICFDSIVCEHGIVHFRTQGVYCDIVFKVLKCTENSLILRATSDICDAHI